MKIRELFSLIESDDPDTAKMLAWQAAVKKEYPELASKLKFKARIEGGKDLMYAMVPGVDRCYGVFDMDTLKGEVLKEDLDLSYKQALGDLLDQLTADQLRQMIYDLWRADHGLSRASMKAWVKQNT